MLIMVLTIIVVEGGVPQSWWCRAFVADYEGCSDDDDGRGGDGSDFSSRAFLAFLHSIDDGESFNANRPRSWPPPW